ncbi:MAG: hypothetical protein AAF799_09120 [Myxococcota bacterium]
MITPSRVVVSGLLVFGGWLGAGCDSAKPTAGTAESKDAKTDAKTAGKAKDEAKDEAKDPAGNGGAEKGKAGAERDKPAAPSGDAAGDGGKAAPAEEPPAAKADDGKAAAAGEPEIILITGTEVGPLTRDMGTVEKLQAAFPGVKIATETRLGEGDEYEIYELSRDGKAFATVEPSLGKVYGALFYDESVHGPFGIHSGTTLAALGKADVVSGCDVEVEGEAHVLCGIKDVYYVQVIYDATKMKGIHPGKTIRKAKIETMPIYALRWMPDDE